MGAEMGKPRIEVSVDPTGAIVGTAAAIRGRHRGHRCGNSRAARLSQAAVATAAAAAAAVATWEAAVAATEAVTAVPIGAWTDPWTAFAVPTAKVLADCEDGSTAAGSRCRGRCRRHDGRRGRVAVSAAAGHGGRGGRCQGVGDGCLFSRRDETHGRS